MVAYLDQAGVQHLIAKIRNTFWPVGTILATSTNTSPASYIGGSWEAYAPGRTLVGVSTTDTDFTLNKQGGAKASPIDLTELYALWANRGTDFIADVETIPGNNTVWRATVKSQTLNHYATTDVANTGVRVTLPAGSKGRTASTLQPYVAVCYWRRVA